MMARTAVAVMVAVPVPVSVLVSVVMAVKQSCLMLLGIFSKRIFIFFVPAAVFFVCPALCSVP